MTKKTIKWAVVAGGLAICVVLVALIGARFQPSDDVVDPLVSSSSSSAEMSKPESEDNLVFVPNSAKSTPEPKPSENNGSNGDSSGTEQTIQPDVSKPEPPKEKPKVENENLLKDPEQPPKYKPGDTEKKPVPKPNQPQNGDKRDGQIYIEGFGWIKDEGGGGEGSTVGNPDDELTGNKVGIM